jgi:hypothetical protein
MQGALSEFTLAQLLQFFAIAERSGTILVRAHGRESRLLVEGDRVIGWGLPSFDVRAAFLACELVPAQAVEAIHLVRPRDDTPGLSFVVRNLVDPERWDAFVKRMLEQDIYPLLSSEEGEFDIQVQRCPPAPLRLSIAVNSLILDGSRWESEMDAAETDGFALETRWRRSSKSPGQVRLSGIDWMMWAISDESTSIGEAARRLGTPDLEAIRSVKRLHGMQLLRLE